MNVNETHTAFSNATISEVARTLTASTATLAILSDDASIAQLGVDSLEAMLAECESTQFVIVSRADLVALAENIAWYNREFASGKSAVLYGSEERVNSWLA